MPWFSVLFIITIHVLYFALPWFPVTSWGPETMMAFQRHLPQQSESHYSISLPFEYIIFLKAASQNASLWLPNNSWNIQATQDLLCFPHIGACKISFWGLFMGYFLQHHQYCLIRFPDSIANWPSLPPTPKTKSMVWSHASGWNKTIWHLSPFQPTTIYVCLHLEIPFHMLWVERGGHCFSGGCNSLFLGCNYIEWSLYSFRVLNEAFRWHEISEHDI